MCRVLKVRHNNFRREHVRCAHGVYRERAFRVEFRKHNARSVTRQEPLLEYQVFKTRHFAVLLNNKRFEKK